MVVFAKRVFGILVNPKKEWLKINQEKTQNIIVTYHLLLLIIFSIFFQLFSKGVRGSLVWKINVSSNSGLFIIIVNLFLVSVIFVNAYILNILSPVFKSEKNYKNAVVLMIYSSIPIYLASVLNLIPAIKLLSYVFTFYSLVLLYMGLPILMKCPQKYAAAYSLVSVLISTVIYIVGGWVVYTIFFSLQAFA